MVSSDQRRARAEQIRDAFSSALELEKGPFNLKGRGYEPRTTLKSHISRILNGLKLPHVTVAQGYSNRYYYPLRLINRAAQLLGIDASEFTSTINLASEGPKPRPTTWTTPDGTVHRRLYRTQVAQLLRPGTRLTLISCMGKPLAESKVVISATGKGFVCDNRPRTDYANTRFGRFDEIFFDLKRNVITIKNSDEIRMQYRIEAAPEAVEQLS